MNHFSFVGRLASMEDLNDLLYFAKVVEYGSFSEASRRLGVPKSSLSRRVSQLEERTGVRLLQRSSRKVSPTSAGAEFFDKCREVVALAQSATESVRTASSEPQGEVRISCPMTLAQVWLTPLLPAFIKSYPKVRLHVLTTNRRLDPVQEQVDVLLRVRRLPLKDSDKVVRKLGEAKDILVASKRYLDDAGSPSVPEELRQHATLCWFGTGARFEWHLTDGTRYLELQHSPRLATDDMLALKEAAVQGAGIALLPNSICAEDIEQARLELVLPAWTSPPAVVQAAFTSRRGMLPAVRCLLNFLAENQYGSQRKP